MVPHTPPFWGRGWGRRKSRRLVAERDRTLVVASFELAKRTFPFIAQHCAERDVAWSDVDLRWGITDEQKAEGTVLPICMREIDRCGPFFIGILGNRYGWVVFNENSSLPIDNATLTFTAVPEPASLGILGAGALLLIRRKRAR